MAASAQSVPNEAAAGGTPIDHAHLARFTLGNRDLEIEVLQLFAQQTPDFVGQLRQAESAKEWRAAAHTIKGSARAVGAHAVGNAAEQAERLTVAMDDPQRAAAIHAIEEALAAAIDYISGL